jgi:uncharacterized membrane protein (DUF485 family)
MKNYNHPDLYIPETERFSENPYKTPNLLLFFTFDFLTKTLIRGFFNPIKKQEIEDLKPENKSKKTFENLYASWIRVSELISWKEKKNENFRFLMVPLTFFFTYFNLIVLIFFLRCAMIVCSVLTPYLCSYFTEWLGIKANLPIANGFVWMVVIFLVQLLNSFITVQVNLNKLKKI